MTRINRLVDSYQVWLNMERKLNLLMLSDRLNDSAFLVVQGMERREEDRVAIREHDKEEFEDMALKYGAVIEDAAGDLHFIVVQAVFAATYFAFDYCHIVWLIYLFDDDLRLKDDLRFD
jgi:hypothetical protein